MVTNWCPLSRKRSMSWKWVSSTSSRTLTSQRSPSPSTQPSRVSSRRPLTVAGSPQSRTSVGPWVTLPSSMPYRRTSVDGSERYKRWELASPVVWYDVHFDPWGTELPIEGFLVLLVLIDRLPSLFIVGTHPVTWLLPILWLGCYPARALWAVGVAALGDLRMYININFVACVYYPCTKSMCMCMCMCIRVAKRKLDGVGVWHDVKLIWQAFVE